MKRTRNINEGRKVRSRNLPRKDRLVKRYDKNGWEVSIYQRPSGDFLVHAFEINGDRWKIESGPSIKAALEAIGQTDADMEKLLEVEE